MRKVFLMMVVAVATTMMAQEAANDSTKKESPWKFSGLVGLDASATGLWNWSAGGKNNVSGVTFGKLRLLYNNPHISWDTHFDIEYGMTWIDQKYDKLQKTSDHLKFDTKIGWAFHPKWYLTLDAAFQTQMAYGLEYSGDEKPELLISNILAPSYTDISVGIDWKPNTIFSVYLSPVSGRITTAYVSDKVCREFVNYNREVTGDPSANDYNAREELQKRIGTWHYDKVTNDIRYSDVRAELGLNFKGAINYEYKGLKVITVLTLFTPYAWDKTKMYKYTVGDEPNVTEAQKVQMMNDDPSMPEEAFKYLGYRDNNRRFGNFDVDWSVAISYQFLKCLNVTLTTDLKYINGLKIKNEGEEVGHERVQFQGIIGLGVGYSF